MSEAEDKRIGSLAVRRGLISQADLDKAVARFQQLQLTGSHIPLGEFLVKEEYLSRRQLEVLLQAQGAKDTREYIPGYEFIKKIGHGGMGDVYLARQKSMDRLVAMKILPPRLAKDKDFIERFFREARLAGKINHVNAVRGVDVGEHSGHYYFVMEYVEGRSLDDMLKESGALPQEQALQVALQVAQVLDYAHAHAIVHRDVKPANVLVTTDGVAKLCDLGLAKQMDTDSQVTMAGVLMGTPHYISPEQARGDSDVDARTDIYSLGAMLYHLVTGQTPFSGTSAAAVMTKHLTEDVSWTEEGKARVSKNCRRLIEKMTAKDPDHRYQEAGALVHDIERVIAGKPIFARVPAAAGTATAARTAAAARAAAKRVSASVRSGEPGTSPAVRPAAEARANGEQEHVEKHRDTTIRRAVPAAAIWSAVGAVLAAAVVVVIAVRHVGSQGPGKTPAPAPGTTAPVKDDTPAPEELDRMLEYARAWAAEHPEDPDGAVERYELVRTRGGGTAWGAKAADAIRDIREKKREAASGAFAAVRARARERADASDYDGAVAAFDALPAGFEEVLRLERSECIAALKLEAAERINAAINAAERFSSEGEPDRGLAALDEISHLKYAAASGRISATRSRLRQEKKDVVETAIRKAEAAARKRLEEAWAEFDDNVLAGDCAGARSVLRVARKDEAIECAGDAVGAGDTLDALEGLAGEIERHARAQNDAAKALEALVGKQVTIETVRGKRTGRALAVRGSVIELLVDIGTGDQTAQTVEKIALADLTPAERARLAPVAAPAGPLGHLAKAVTAIGRVSNGGGENGSSRAASAIAEAKKSLAAAEGHVLTAHYREHLNLVTTDKTEARAQKPAVTHSQEPRKPAGASDAVTIDTVRKIFRGRVKTFDPATYAVELFYDFGDESQAEDWTAGNAAIVSWKNGCLRCSVHSVISKGGIISHKGAFAQGELSVRCDVRVTRSRNSLSAFAFYTDTHHFANVSLDPRGPVLMCFFRQGRGAEIKAGARPFEAPAQGTTVTLECTYVPDRVTASVAGTQVMDTAIPSPGLTRPLHPAFTGQRSSRLVDNLVIKGTLDRAWLESEAAR